MTCRDKRGRRPCPYCWEDTSFDEETYDLLNPPPCGMEGPHADCESAAIDAYVSITRGETA